MKNKLFLLFGLFAFTAFAQDTDNSSDVEEVVQVEEITIIGSRIKRTTTFDSPVPVTIVTGEDFENRLFDYAASAVTRLPSAAGAESGPNGSQAINNLRLGSQRTLVTVNGNRFVSSNGYGGGQVDVNNIPTMLIDRVEVINIGGAAVYGSDAVAGVVNYILKDDFEGFKFQYNHNNSFEDIALQRGYKMLFGGNFMDGRGNVTVSLDYTSNGRKIRFNELPQSVVCRGLKTDSNGAVPGQSFVMSRCLGNTYFGISPNGSVTFGDILNTPGALGLAPNASGLAWPGTPQTDYVGFDDNGKLKINYQGFPTDGVLRYAGGDGMNFGYPHSPTVYNEPIEKYNFVQTGRFDVTPRMRVSGSVYLTSYSAEDASGNQGFYTTGLFGSPSNTLTVECTNPYLSAADSAELCANWSGKTNSYGNKTFDMSKAWGPYVRSLGGEDVDTVDNRVFNLRIEGDFDLADRTFDYSWGVTDGVSQRVNSRGDIIKARLFAAIDSILLPDGTIDCRYNQLGASGYTTGEYFNDPYMQPGGTQDPSYALLGEPGDCMPLSPFGDGSQITDGAANYVGGSVSTRTNTEQNYNFGYISGPVYDLPAGEVSVLVGYEERTEVYKFKDALIDEAYLADQSGGMTALTGKFSTSDTYMEVIAPIISPDMSIPFVEELTLSGAYREMDHSVSGEDNVDSLSLVWRLNSALAVRYNIQNTVRSPAIGEAFQPQFISSYIIDDPCDASNIGTGPAPDNRAANCAQLGNPAGWLSQAETASIFTYRGGNPNLLTEKSDSSNIGIIYTPTNLPFTDIEIPGNLRLALDYIEVDLTDAIVDLNPDQVMSACYDAASASYPNSFCNQVFRGPDNQMLGFDPGTIGVQGGTSNGSTYDYQSYIVEVAYDIDLDQVFDGAIGTFGYNLKGYQEKKDAFQATAASPIEDVTGSIGKPENRFLHTWDWSYDDWYVYVDGVYTDGGLTDFYWDKEAFPDKYVYMDMTDGSASSKVLPHSYDGYWSFSGGVVYDYSENLSAVVRVTNLNDNQCSGDDCYNGYQGYWVPRTFSFGVRFEY
jgi:outer membrane receptor protein involved in Fe transport